MESALSLVENQLHRPTLSVVDVGHGNCAVLAENGHRALIDAGRGNSLINYLNSIKITHIDVIIVSHTDEDHLGGLLGILTSDQFSVGHVLINADGEKNTKLWDDVRAALNSSYNKGKIKLRPGVFAGVIEEWQVGATRIEVISPSAHMVLGGPGSKDQGGKAISANSSSIVLRVSYDDKPVVLLSADMEDKTLEDIVRNGRDISAPIVVYPHHGGRTGQGSVEEFVEKLIDQTKPTTVVFSNGRGMHGTPRPEIVSAIRKSVDDVRIMCTQLSNHCSDAEVLDGRDAHLLDVYSHGFESGKCCAGTIQIDLSNISINRCKEHTAFVARFPKALCQIKPVVA